MAATPDAASALAKRVFDRTLTILNGFRDADKPQQSERTSTVIDRWHRVVKRRYVCRVGEYGSVAALSAILPVGRQQFDRSRQRV